MVGTPSWAPADRCEYSGGRLCSCMPISGFAFNESRYFIVGKQYGMLRVAFFIGLLALSLPSSETRYCYR